MGYFLIILGPFLDIFGMSSNRFKQSSDQNWFVEWLERVGTFSLRRRESLECRNPYSCIVADRPGGWM